MLRSVGLDLFWQTAVAMKKRKASPLLPSRQTLPSNGSLCIQEFVFEVRFNISSENGH